MNHEPLEDHMNLFSGLYPSALFTQGESKPRRKRNKKKKGGEKGDVGSSKKRKLSIEQISVLEQNFSNEHKLESERKDSLALELGLDPRQVAVWFQNRRSRWKAKKLEEEYSNLKNLHQITMLTKCHLQTQVLKLEEQLLQAKKEIQRLQECSEITPTNSNISSSSQSLELVNPPFFEEFRVEECDHGDVFYINGMEWINPFM